MKIELFDRHAEHVDPNVPLCVHPVSNGGNIEYGDTVRVMADMELPEWLVSSRIVEAKAEVEIHFVSKKLVRIIVNHADYLAAKAKLEQSRLSGWSELPAND